MLGLKNTRSHLINRKGIAFAKDRRPPERLSGIYEIASIELAAATRRLRRRSNDRVKGYARRVPSVLVRTLENAVATE